MNPALLIAAWLLVNVLAIAVYDVIAYFFLPPDQSVSYWLQTWFSAWPMLAVMVGVVIGHLCWPLHRGDWQPRS